MATSDTDILLGYGSVVGFGIETAWGTAQSTLTYMPVIQARVRRERPQQPRPHLNTGTGRVANNHYAELDDVTVNLDVECGYDTIGTFLRAAMGPAPSTTGSDPYVHPYLLGDALVSLTLRVYVGSTSGGAVTARYHNVVGCKLNTLTLRVVAGEVPRLSMEFIGKTVESYADQGTPTIVHPTPVLYHQAGNFGWNSASYDCNEFEITISNGLERRRHVGSLNTAEPHPSARRDVMLRMTRDHADEELLAALIAETESDLTVTFSGSGDDEMAITLHAAKVQSPSELGGSEGQFGAMPETVEFIPRNVPGGTDYGLVIQITNNDASYLT